MQIEVRASVHVTGDLPRGSSRFRALIGNGQTGVSSHAAFYELDFSKRLTHLEHPLTFVKKSTSDGSPCELAAQSEVYYRGHLWSDDDAVFQVWPCPPKGVRFRYSPPPDQGTVLVDGLDRRPLLFILDGSGSMKESLKQDAQTRKITAAKDSLYAVLETMAKSNTSRTQKREAAFFAFGHTVVLDKDGNSTYPPQRLKTWPGGEGRSLEIVDASLIQRLKNVLLDKTQFEPQGNTMLLKAIRDACIHLRDARQSGLIVAITDGADSLVEEDDPRWRPLFSEIKQLRQTAAARGTEIELHLVAFDVDPEDSELLRNLNFGNRDRFFNAPNAQKLAADLHEATDPRPYTVLPASRITGGSPRTEPLGVPVNQLRPGRYEIHFGAIDPIELEIRGGEMLRYQLDSGGLDWIKLTEVPLVTGASSTGTQEFAVTRFTVNLETSQATFHLSLYPKDSSIPFESYPDEIEFAISALDDAKSSRPVSWQVLPAQSIPSWQVTVGDWPGRSGAQVQAVWKNERTPNSSIALEEGRTVELGIIAGRDRSLRLVKVGVPKISAGEETTISVECRIAPPLSGPTDSTVFQSLAGIQLELMSRQNVIGSTVTREVIEEDGVINATFGFTPVTSDEKYRLGVTPWRARLNEASRVSQPLVLATPQN